jgi:receptor protein-tyrosine kinase
MAENPTPDSGRSELEQILRTLGNRWRLIAACFAATTLAALGFSLLQTKEYSASASLLFRDPGYAQALFGTAVTAANPDPAREAATNVKLVGLDIVAERASQALDGRITGAEVASKIEVAQQGESDVVSVTATDQVPATAKRLANTFARQFIVFRTAADRSKLRNAQRLAERQFERLTDAERVGARGESLSRAAERLGVLASLQTGNAELVQPADLPSSPSSPQTKRNVVLGAVLGLLLGIGLAFLFERLNRRLRDPEEVSAAYDLPVLGTIPFSKTLGEGDGHNGLPFFEDESFRTLRAALRYFNVDRDVRSVVLTSYAAGEGKSTIAWNLATVAASTARVVVVEADLRNPGIAAARGLARSPGLAEVLTHQVDVLDATQEVPPSAWGGVRKGDGSLSLVAAGATPPNPAELLESQAMTDLLKRLEAEYDFVVVDTPPTGVVSDAFPLVSKVAGVIIVSRLGRATRDSAVRLRDQLRQLNAPLLGVVANGVKRRGRGAYGYGRGYYGQQDVPSGEPATSAGG